MSLFLQSRTRLLGLYALVVLLLAPLTVRGQALFQQPQVVKYAPLGNPWPASFATGSFQKTGTTDLVAVYPPIYVPNSNGTTDPEVIAAQILNNGSGSFSFPSLGSIGFDETTGVVTAVADFNGDGIPDIAFAETHPVAGYEDLCVVYMGPGGAFSSTACTVLPFVRNAMPSLTYIAPISFKTGGLPQLLVEDSANNMLYVIANSGGIATGALTNFSVKAQYAIPAADGAGPIATGDFNGDGNMDFIVNGQAGHSASVYLGNGDGTFQAATHSYFSNFGVNSMLLHDMDGDGIADAVVEEPNGSIEIFPGHADGSFGSVSIGGSYVPSTLGGGGHLIGVVDLNHDGILDILTATPAGVSVIFGSGHNLYLNPNVYNAGPGHTAYALLDFNGDGNLDLAVDSPEGIAILYGNPDGSFQTSMAYPAGLPATSAAVVNQGPNANVLADTGVLNLAVFQGFGNGTFLYSGAANYPTTAPGLYASGALGDFNGDGVLDAAITFDGPDAAIPTSATNTGMAVLYGIGTSSGLSLAYPQVNTHNPCASAPADLYGTSAIADFNGDGIVDLANRDASGVRLFFGQSAVGLLPSSATYLDGNCNLHAHDLILAGDLNNDGQPDLLVQTDGHLVVALNQGNGAFPASIAPSATNDLSVNGALTTPGQLTAPALSSTFNGPAIPVSAGGLGFPAFPGSAVIADLDRDGNNDLIVSYANLSANRAAPTSSAPNYIYIWYGSGGGKFLTSAAHPVNPVVLTPSRNFYQIAVADLNGDGIPDLILSDGYILSVQNGNGDGTFGAEQHYLAGQGLNTISVADLDHNGTLDLVVANGGTVWGNPVANLDQPPAAQDVNTGGITVLLNRAVPALPAISATVTATPEPSAYGSAFTLTAAITSSTSSNPVTGSFSFAIDGIPAGSATISGTSAVFSVPSSVYATLAPGVHTLTAVYSGDANWASATFTGTHNVSQNPTSLNLLLCVDPPNSNFPCANPISSTPLISPIVMYYGQSVDGVAIESALNLTGTISFYSGGSTFCVLSANLQQGTQTCPQGSGIFPAGTTTVTAVYSGDTLNAPSTSNGIVVNVLPDVTTATLTTSLNPATQGQTVTFTASVQGNFTIGAGQVIFLDGSTQLGTATLDPTGHATFTTSTLAVGTHPISVAFPGSRNFNSVTSATLQQVITSAVAAPVTSVVTLASSVNPSTPGQAVVFAATVSLTGTSAVTPSGTVTFLDGSVILGTATVNPARGIATFTTSTLAVGSHPITASYSGVTSTVSTTPSILPGVSAVLTQIVAAVTSAPGSGFALTVTPTPVTIGVGDTGILLVNVQAGSGFTQPVKLTCTGLPTESSCTFIQPLMPSGGGATTLQVAVSAPHSCDNNTPYFVSSTGDSGMASKIALCTLAGGGLWLAGMRKRRRMLAGTILTLLVSLGGFALISGCGACTDLGTKPGVYSFTVVATAQGGPSTAVQTQTVPMTVTIP